MYTYKGSDISDRVFTSSCVNKTQWNKQMSRAFAVKQVRYTVR